MLDFDYQNAMRQAQRLSDSADELDRRGARRLAEVMEGIRSVWSGTAANQYQMECENTRQEILRCVHELHTLAGFIRDSARAIDAAEQAAKQKFSSNQIR